METETDGSGKAGVPLVTCRWCAKECAPHYGAGYVNSCDACHVWHFGAGGDCREPARVVASLSLDESGAFEIVRAEVRARDVAAQWRGRLGLTTKPSVGYTKRR